MHRARLSKVSSRDTPFESRTKDEVTSTKERQTLTMPKHKPTVSTGRCCSWTWRNRFLSSFHITRHPHTPGDPLSFSTRLVWGPEFLSLTYPTTSSTAKASPFLYAWQEFNTCRHHPRGDISLGKLLSSLVQSCLHCNMSFRTNSHRRL